MSAIEYNNDQNQLLKTYIEKNYFPNIFRKSKDKWEKGAPVEFIVRPECNQKCKYCYITQHGNELYPKEKRVSKEIYLQHLEAFLNWLFDNKIFIPRYELFAGDLFADNLYYDIIDVFDKCLSKIPKDEYEDLIKEVGNAVIVTPSNCFYFQYPEHQEKMREYTKKMLDKHHFILGISWSTDGYYSADSREDAGKKSKVDEEYYNKIFAFVKEMGYGVHPMIAPENVQYAIQNFNWWTDKFKAFDLVQKDYPYPTFLEVRNGYWTDEQILQFTKFIRYIWDYKLKLNDNSMKRLARHLFVGDGEDDSLPTLQFYDPCVIHFAGQEDRDILGCNMASTMRVNLADLSFPICHRLTYPQFVGGHCELNNDNVITNIIADKGLSSYMQIRTLSPQYYPKCANCDYNHACLHGCLGAQYEHSGEILAPISCVCKLEQAKINTLLELYVSSGMLQDSIDDIEFLEKKDWILKMAHKVGGYESEG